MPQLTAKAPVEHAVTSTDYERDTLERFASSSALPREIDVGFSTEVAFSLRTIAPVLKSTGTQTVQ
ncbi:hypothetical protein [Pseudoclavibacter sp. VKM Ac-2867]|uniref:hypothetical protein n=1 Tax=Pseudoclavibacter sp. VKM Ac-2867 TaxID=2783829 RepID=UPI00188B5DBD|nr:hypothetical protein [Pseudoclavibacter sp. VKM Ac-2867]MBF4460522.1 hypothetical protein [Pseudoclavibacter sp. VKM Ac-2867]